MTSVGVWVAAFLTLSIFSFLYKDNPFYKFAEHLMVGVSAGYWVILLFYNVLLPDAIDPLFTEGKWYYIIPLILGLLMWTRLFKKTAWISRYPLAFYLGIATGVAIPLEMKAKVIEQLYGSVGLVAQMHEMDAGFGTVINNVVILIGVFSSLIYFFFSKEHTGITGRVSQVGIGVLMIGFGASFGFTVMARVSLLIERVQFLLFEWLKFGA
ncbi:MAG: hypothetical protein GF341_06470 [candidate division Zixibacteria bacterium]|nr:hypothetical protein [candidate division Zixibacteria bacterium]